MKTVTILFTNDNIGKTLNDGCIFFEKNVKPLVTDDTEEIQFGLDVDSINLSFLFGIFVNVIDMYIAGKEESALKILFDDRKIYAFFSTVAIALKATLDAVKAQEQEQNFLS